MKRFGHLRRPVQTKQVGDAYTVALKNLKLQQGDILVIEGHPQPDLIARLIEASKIAFGDNPPNVPIVILGDTKLSAVDEMAMAAAGWMRIAEVKTD